MSDIFKNPVAFAPFFDTPVEFRITRTEGTRRGTCAACVNDEGFSESFDDNGTSTKIRQLSFAVRRLDWLAAAGSEPQSGDKFISPHSRRVFALVEVTSFGGDTWAITAREVSS